MTARSQPIRLLITCEHGGNEVPAEWKSQFEGAEAQRYLNSHRGYDPGSLAAAKSIASFFDSRFEFSTVSRLVVDLNRSLDSPQLFSKFLDQETEATKNAILDTYYHPYRCRVTSFVRQSVDAGQRVLHLSVHTFTPRYRGSARKLDIGVLFDPGRQGETRFSQRLLDDLTRCGMRAFPNEPYLGIADGLTTTLRTLFGDADYAGIELELSNRVARLSEKTVARWHQQMTGAIERALGDAV